VFLGYSNIHKGFKYLDVAEGRIYISCDVVFNEMVFPFSKLNPNARARLRVDILLLPTTSQPSTVPSSRVKFSDDSRVNVQLNPVSTNPLALMQLLQEIMLIFMQKQVRTGVLYHMKYRTRFLILIWFRLKIPAPVSSPIQMRIRLRVAP
jgi:hypothetical protein